MSKIINIKGIKVEVSASNTPMLPFDEQDELQQALDSTAIQARIAKETLKLARLKAREKQPLNHFERDYVEKHIRRTEKRIAKLERVNEAN
jgi:Na+/phosphate symporter